MISMVLPSTGLMRLKMAMEAAIFNLLAEMR